MKLLILLSCVFYAQARVFSSCDGVVINDIYHEKEALTSTLDRPYLLTVDYDTDTLYFSYNIARDSYETARLNLKTNEIKVIKDIPNGFSSAIDRQNKVIYIGTTDGIYAYNYEHDTSEFYGAKGVFVWTLLLKDDVLYYTVHPTQELYSFTNGESTRVKYLESSKVHNFMIDNDDDATFDNSTGLFTWRKGEEEARRYNKNFYILDMRTLTLDQHGKLYACFDDGVYAVNKHEMKLEKVLNIYDSFGVTFDKDNNMIYSDAEKVYKLTPNKDSNCSK